MLKFDIHPQQIILFFKPRSLSATIKQELLDIGGSMDLFIPEVFQVQVSDSFLRGKVSNYSYRDVSEYTSITPFTAYVVTKRLTLPYNYTKDSLRAFSLATYNTNEQDNFNQKTVAIYVIKVRAQETYDRLAVLEQNQHLVTSTSQLELFLREIRGITIAPLREQEAYEEPPVW
jgi:hypothetical protein